MAHIFYRSPLVWASVFCGHLLGCAQLQPPIERTDRVVVQSVTESRSEDGELVVTDLVAEHDHVVGLVRREQHCQTVRLEEVEHQKVRAYEAEGVGLDVAAGTLFGVGGIGLLMSAPQFSNEPGINAEGDEVASNRDLALGIGTLLLFGGAWALGNGLYVFAQTGDRAYERPWTTMEERGRSPLTSCGFSAPKTGTLEISRGRRVLVRRSIEEGVLDINLRSHPELCADMNHLGEAVEMVYYATDRPGGSIALGEHDLDACIRSREVHNRLVTARKEFENLSSSADIARIAIGLDEAGQIFYALPADDPDRAHLRAQHAELVADMSQAARGLLDELLLTYDQTVKESGGRRALPAALGSLGLSRIIEGAETSTWIRIYGDYVSLARRNPEEMLSAIEALLVEDHATRECLQEVQNSPSGDLTETLCPAWLEATLVQESFAPLMTALSSQVSERTTELNRATVQLERKVNEANFQKLVGPFEDATEVLSLCESPLWMKGLEAPCEALHASRDEAMQVALASQTALEKLAVERTARAWRGQFAQCRKVADGIEAFRNVSRCDASCQRIRSRIIADRDGLLAFTVADASWDAQTLEQVRSECRAARCPRCP